MTLRLARRWPILRVDAPIAFIPEQAERLSNNEARQLQRVTRALALFLRDYEDTDTTCSVSRAAARQAVRGTMCDAGRALVWGRRGLEDMSRAFSPTATMQPIS